MIVDVPSLHAVSPILREAMSIMPPVAGFAWFLPALIGAGSSLLGSIFGNKGKQQPMQVPPGPLADYMKTGMIPGSGGGGSSSGTSTTTQNMTRSFDNTTSPFFTPEFAKAGGMMRALIERRLSAPSALPHGYESGGIQDINTSYAGAGQALANKLASTGLASSPAAAAGLRRTEMDRGSDIARFRQNVPIVERQLDDQNTQLMASLLDTFGKGTRQKGTETTKGTTTTNSSQSSSGGGERFDPSFLLQQLQNQSTGKGNFWDSIGDIGGLLGAILGQKGSSKSAATPDPSQGTWYQDLFKALQ